MKNIKLVVNNDVQRKEKEKFFVKKFMLQTITLEEKIQAQSEKK